MGLEIPIEQHTIYRWSVAYTMKRFPVCQVAFLAYPANNLYLYNLRSLTYLNQILIFRLLYSTDIQVRLDE